jgi:hypothetical protein
MLKSTATAITTSTTGSNKQPSHMRVTTTCLLFHIIISCVLFSNTIIVNAQQVNGTGTNDDDDSLILPNQSKR